jgi:cell volume regulation protein A
MSVDESVRGFHRQMVFIIKSFFFVFIGAMLAPSWFLLLGVALAGVLLAARIPGVQLVLMGRTFTPAQKQLVVISMPRGMAAWALATLPVAQGIVWTEQLPVTVFACVLATILIFAVGFPIIKRRMDTIPDIGNQAQVEVPGEIERIDALSA